MLEIIPTHEENSICALKDEIPKTNESQRKQKEMRYKLHSFIIPSKHTTIKTLKCDFQTSSVETLPAPTESRL